MAKAIVGALSVGLAMAGAAVAQSPVTPEEVVAKVRQAAAYLEREGKAGLAVFDQAESPFVWKDTYVFVLDCAADRNAAHPAPTSRGATLSTLRDKAGAPLGELMCMAAKRPGGSWVEYMWPAPVAADAGKTGGLTLAAEPSRKVTYMLSVPGQPFQVGAGIYNAALTVEELNQLTE